MKHLFVGCTSHICQTKDSVSFSLMRHLKALHLWSEKLVVSLISNPPLMLECGANWQPLENLNALMNT